LTISSTNRKAGPFTGNGVTVAFPFAFKVFAAADVLVVQAVTATGVETTKVLTTDYAVALNADQNANPGGTVTLLTSPPVGTTLTLASRVGNLQPVDLTNQGGFYPKVINDALDRVTIQVQQVAESQSRAVALAISTPGGVSAALPAPLAGAFLGWDPTATALLNYSGLASVGVSGVMAPVVTGVTLAAARTALGASATGSSVFTAADAAAARTALGVVSPDSQLLYKADYDSVGFTKTGAQTLSLKAGTSIQVAGVFRTWLVDTAVTMPALVAGTDYAIWANPDGTLQAVADPYSAPASAPQANSRKIGGFHFGLVPPATTVAGGGFSSAGFTNTGGSMIWTQALVDNIAGINAYSVWDLMWRCVGEQSGLALDPQTRTWLGIYFCPSGHITNGISRYNTDVASGTVLPLIPVVYGGTGATAYGRFSFYEATEIAASHGLRLPTFAEFSSAAFGVTEAQSLGGAASTIPATARQAGYTSRIGLEQATGHQCAIGGPLSSVGGAGWDASPGRGSFYGTTGLPLFGGSRSDTSNSGSRAALFGGTPWYSYWGLSLRAAGDHKKLKGIGS
jgi:hypothetical protein